MGTGLALPRRQRGGFHSVPASSTASAASRVWVFCAWLVCVPALLFAKDVAKNTDLWSLKGLARPEIPPGVCSSTNPIDAFIGETYRDQGLSPLSPADKLTWLRRVTFDHAGLSRIFCNIHPNMGAYVIAVDTPYFATAYRGRTEGNGGC